MKYLVLLIVVVVAIGIWRSRRAPDAAVQKPPTPPRVALPQDMPLALQGALYSRVTTIYGGSSEIQRNIIARRALGL